MKTTVELPDGLYRQIKLKAVLDGRKVRETMEDLLRAGLAAESAGRQRPPSTIGGELPVVKCRHSATPETEMTPDRLSTLLEKQDAEWYAKPRR